jgi:hypothetical protein
MMSKTFIRLDKLRIEELDGMPIVTTDVQAGLTCKWCGRPILPNYERHVLGHNVMVWTHVRPKCPQATGYCGQYRKTAEPMGIERQVAERGEIIIFDPFENWG